MPNLIDFCINSAITTEVAKVFFINATNKFSEVIKQSRHEYYVKSQDFDLLEENGVFSHNGKDNVLYDVIICDDIPNSFLHVVNMGKALHTPFIHLMHSRPTIKMETFYLFVRDAKDHPKIFLNEEIFKFCMSPQTNSHIGVEDWDQIIENLCNKAFVK